MKKAEIQERISNALEAELMKIYEELRIESGDIAPWHLIEWDNLTDQMATIFCCLIMWNSGEEE